MPANQLNISIIQPDIIWEDKRANMKQYEAYIVSVRERREVIVLPEMFTTGFSMDPQRLAENMDGASVQWMKDMASKYRCILTGSLIIEEHGNYYNRLVWMQPDGNFGVYDKRHLFAYATEDEHYTAGNRRFIASVKGWKLNLQICYDLRFPVWARQLQGKTDDSATMPEYDILVYVANWPERRIVAWKTLLQARAIENQSYVVGVNRVGVDGTGINYTGESSVFDAMGERIWSKTNEACVQTVALEKEHLKRVRQDLPFLKDADNFLLL